MDSKNKLIENPSPTSLLVFFLMVLVCLFSSVSSTYGRDVSFAWTANTENVDGYRLYYKTGTGGTPYDGSGATEGASPVDVGNVTSYTLHNISDSEDYFFVLTAYMGAEESVYSTELALSADSPSSGRSVTFSWTANSDGVDGYRLYYKTGSSGPPYDGSDAVEGPSPIDTGNVTTYTISGLSQTETYYFALTAYKGADQSSYSDELVLAPSSSNSPPTASGSLAAATEDTVYNGQLSASDGDNDPLTYSIVTGASKGSAVITDSSAGNFRYTPNANINGNDSFTFKVNDGTVDSAQATVNITIAAVNDSPTASSGSLSTAEDSSASGKLVADDIDGDVLTYSIVTNGSSGTATITNSASGDYTYTPSPNVNGSDSFTFRVNDGTVNSSTATVSVTITAQNDSPVAAAKTINVDEDTVAGSQLSGTDPDGDSLTFAIVSNAGKGSAAITNPATGDFTYTPDANATGSDSFTFKVNDGTVDSAPATVSISITAQNDAPTAGAASITTLENNVYTGQLSGNDIDGDSLTFSIAANGSKGTAVITDSGSGSFTYTPNSNVSGSDSFTFTVNDGTISSAAATVSVTITDVNNPPVAGSGAISTNEDTSYSGLLSGSDADEDSLTFMIGTNSSLGSTVITNPATGAYTYTPNENVSGSDSFTFTVNDGTVDSAAAAMSITITPVNDPPLASGDTIVTDENTAFSGQLSGTDIDGDTLTYSIVSNGSKGSVVITDTAAGDFTYTPNNNVSGSDTFTFRVNDGTVNSATATIDVTITLVNSAPAAADIALTTDRNTEISDQLPAHDLDGDSLTYTLVTNGSRGTAVITNAATGAFTYTPDVDEVGVDSFTYKVNDGLVDSQAATVSLRILDDATLTAVFGDNYATDYPGTVADTSMSDSDVHGDGLTLRTYSFGSQAPHKIAGTAVVKADVTDIPAYATVIEAKLMLYQTTASGFGQYKTSVHRITGMDPLPAEATGYMASTGQQWTAVPPGTTYSDMPLGVADIEAQEDMQLLFEKPGYRSWLITAMVQDWIARPSTNFGLLLVGEEVSEETARIFASSENSNMALRPQLIVRYKLIPRPPSLIMIEEIK